MMKKIKVLQFPITNARSGVAQYMLNNWKFIDKNRFHFDFATLNKKLDIEEELKEQGCKVHYLSCYAEENEARFIDEFNRILEEGYDIVHLHTSYWKSFLVEELAIKYGVSKIIVHSHSTMVDIIDEQAREAAIELHNIRREQFHPSLATDFWACSWLAADWLFGESIPREQIRIMNNAVDVESFTHDKNIRQQCREKLELEDSFVLGHIGRFVYQKNHEMLIEMFREVSSILPNPRLLLIGKGPMEESIRKKAVHYGIDDKIRFMGVRNDVNELLQAMDIFLLPSRFEGLPIVLVEAQASGIKCIASDSVSREVGISPAIDYVSLNVNQWVEKILHYSKGYDRIKTDSFLTGAGFNIRSQIKELEHFYSTL